jgi:hypothetical protein
MKPYKLPQGYLDFKEFNKHLELLILLTKTFSDI